MPRSDATEVAVVDLATKQHSPKGVAVDATYVYFTRVVDAAKRMGEIVRINK